ncbi:hypothetical protein [Desulfosporosinus orientis]|uniref:hypothetical protein n=1 Tax=Desulfosporosinus orientis TaxID=1563 RepID=UPI0005A81393
MIEELIAKVDMQGMEKKEFLNRLEAKEQQLSMMRERIRELSSQLEQSEDYDTRVVGISGFIWRLRGKRNP